MIIALFESCLLYIYQDMVEQEEFIYLLANTKYRGQHQLWANRKTHIWAARMIMDTELLFSERQARFTTE